jgi:feruloyl esterase
VPFRSGQTDLSITSSADDASCLTKAQADAIKKVYDGARNPRTGEQIFTGWPRGSEGFGETAGQGWRQYLTEPGEPSRVGLFRYFLFHDPNWDWRTLDYDRDLAYAEQRLAMLFGGRASDAFKKHGNKLIVYTGWADPVCRRRTQRSITKQLPRQWRLRQISRLLPVFRRAGMGHCAGGPGRTSSKRWPHSNSGSKRDRADKLIASHTSNGKVDRTRPLCPYPQVARWKGTGSIDEAANFSCVAPETATRKTTTTQSGQQ